MFALRAMLEGPSADVVQPLSDAGRLRIIDTAKVLLQNKLTWVNQIAIVALVLATKDAALRFEVEALASNASLLRTRGVTDQARITQVQNSMRAQLSRPPKP